MSKWSSYKEQQQLHEGWRRFLNEDAEPSGGENLEEIYSAAMLGGLEASPKTAGAGAVGYSDAQTIAQHILQYAQAGASERPSGRYSMHRAPPSESSLSALGAVLVYASPFDLSEAHEGLSGTVKPSNFMLNKLISILEEVGLEEYFTQGEHAAAAPKVVALLSGSDDRALRTMKRVINSAALSRHNAARGQGAREISKMSPDLQAHGELIEDFINQVQDAKNISSGAEMAAFDPTNLPGLPS